LYLNGLDASTTETVVFKKYYSCTHFVNPKRDTIFDQAFAITVLTVRPDWSQIDLFSLNGCLIEPSGAIFTLNGTQGRRIPVCCKAFCFCV
jgi:hypothetical protein